MTRPTSSPSAAATAAPLKVPTVHLRLATTADDFSSFASLSKSYATWLGEDLSFQGFEQEMAALPGCYAEPAGCIVLASIPADTAGTNDDTSSSINSTSSARTQDVGCVALRPLASTYPGHTRCEMKRLFVLPEHAGQGIGHLLVKRVLLEAGDRHYTTMLLDTLPRLTAANKLYQQFGFQHVGPYYRNPLPGVLYWSKQMQTSTTS